MLNWLNKFIFYFTSNASLRMLSWKKVKDKYPELYSHRKTKITVFLQWLNTFQWSFLLIFGIFSILTVITWSGIQNTSYLSFVNLVYLEPEKALKIISNNVGNIASTLGLSFIVIGFLVEVIRSVATQTFKEIFNYTGLPFYFSISINSLLFVIILNQLSKSIPETILLDFAVLSNVFFVILIIAIFTLFTRVIQLFNPEKIRDITFRNFDKSVKNQRLNELVSMESKKIYKQKLNDKGLTETDFYSVYFSRENPNLVYLAVNKPQFLKDVNFLLYFKAINKLNTDHVNNYYFPLNLGKNLRQNSSILSLSSGSQLSKFQYWLLNIAFLLSSESNDEEMFIERKERIFKELDQNIYVGNNQEINTILDELNALYQDFLKTSD